MAPVQPLSRHGTAVGLLLGVAFCGLAAATPAPAQLAGPGDGVWITVGEDSFATLLAFGDLRDAGLPLQRYGEGAGVVLTRVDRRDLERIAERLHAAYRRCASFVVHDSAAEGLDALATLERPPALEAPAFTIDQGPVVQQLQAAVSEPPMLATIFQLSTGFNNRYYQHPPGVAAALWIRDLWEGYAAARTDISVELFDHSWPQPSVILTIQGVELPEEVVVLGGHLDSTAPGTSNPDFLAPGADDNASGIAVLSEVARVAVTEGFRPQRTVQIMGYAAEEVGLLGSDDIAEAYEAAGIDVVAVLQLDMTDFNGSVEDVVFIDDYVDPTLTAFLGQLLDAYQPDLAWTTDDCGYPCSDHASWTFSGYAAAFPFEARFGQHNPAIHTVNDTLDTLGNSVAHAAKFARLAAAFLVETAKASDTTLFGDGFETGTTDRWSVVVP